MSERFCGYWNMKYWSKYGEGKSVKAIPVSEMKLEVNDTEIWCKDERRLGRQVFECWQDYVGYGIQDLANMQKWAVFVTFLNVKEREVGGKTFLKWHSWNEIRKQNYRRQFDIRIIRTGVKLVLIMLTLLHATVYVSYDFTRFAESTSTVCK
jgi:hypothetical protein